MGVKFLLFQNFIIEYYTSAKKYTKTILDLGKKEALFKNQKFFNLNLKLSLKTQSSFCLYWPSTTVSKNMQTNATGRTYATIQKPSDM